MKLDFAVALAERPTVTRRSDPRANPQRQTVRQLRTAACSDTSLSATAAKMVSLDRVARAPAANDPVNLGMPALRPAP
jgi:hypothetical protein